MSKNEPELGEWLQEWLRRYKLENSLESELQWENDPFLPNKYSLANSPCEVALEVYNAIQSQNLSLEQLIKYINTVGTIISNVNLRAVAAQPLSMQKQMISVILVNDCTNCLLECHKPNSFGYVYLLVRLLFEILLYTKSLAVRSVAYSQIKRNSRIIKHLLSLIVYPFDEANCEYPFPRSNYVNNVLVEMFQNFVQHSDLNLQLCGIQLLSLAPAQCAASPELMSALRICLTRDDDDECNVTVAGSLYSILQFAKEFVALDFLHAAFQSASKFPSNCAKIEAFVLVILGLVSNPKLAKIAYNLCWDMINHLTNLSTQTDTDERVKVQMQFFLIFASCVTCPNDPEIVQKQNKQLEVLENESNKLYITYCQFILQRRTGYTPESIHNLSVLVEKLGHFPSGNKSIKLESLLRYEIARLRVQDNCGKIPTNQWDYKTLFSDIMEGLDADLFLNAIAKTIISTDRPEDVLNQMLRDIGDLYTKLKLQDRLRLFRCFEVAFAITICLHQSSSVKIPEPYPEELQCIFGDASTVDNFNVDFKSNASRYVFMRALLGVMYSCMEVDRIENCVTIIINLINGQTIAETSVESSMDSVTEIVYYNQTVENDLGVLISKMVHLNASQPEEMYHAMVICYRLGIYELGEAFAGRLGLYTSDLFQWFNAFECWGHGHVQDVFKIDEFVQYQRRCLYALEACTIATHVEIGHKYAYDRGFTGLNYYPCNFALQNWCILLLVLKVALGHLLAEPDYPRLYCVFLCLRMQYLVYKYLYKHCPETMQAASILEAVSLIGLKLSPCDYPINIQDVFDCFNLYISGFDPSLSRLDTLDILKMVPPFRNKVATIKLYGSSPNFTAAQIWSQLALHFKVRQGRRLHCFKRCTAIRTAIQRSSVAIMGLESNHEILNALLSIDLPTPIGVLKAYPLCFAALVATLEIQKQQMLYTIEFQGTIRNLKVGDVVPLVCIYEDTSNGALLHAKFKMRQNSLYARILINLENQDVTTLKFMSLPLDLNCNPLGMPSPVYLVKKHI
ncbi:hypothetical protein BdWA1_003256 [Babesia duncani]|uniref:Uncharacterized protein n=1 Tax=Babesia duncani TaxID=323732 RepID=A0AAD9UN62_9APIC|nr:hypothetical protein BdWA1_003256 [Babesia duncani]